MSLGLLAAGHEGRRGLPGQNLVGGFGVRIIRGVHQVELVVDGVRDRSWRKLSSPARCSAPVRHCVGAHLRAFIDVVFLIQHAGRGVDAAAPLLRNGLRECRFSRPVSAQSRRCQVKNQADQKPFHWAPAFLPRFANILLAKGMPRRVLLPALRNSKNSGSGVSCCSRFVAPMGSRGQARI